RYQARLGSRVVGGEPVLGDRPPELHALAQAQLAHQPLKPRAFAGAAVFSKDQEPGRGMLAACRQQRERTQDDVNSLQRLQAPQEDEEPVVGVAKPQPGLLSGLGSEDIQVDARRHHGDAVSRHMVGTAQGIRLRLGAYDQQVRAPGDLALQICSYLRFGGGAGRQLAVLDDRECVGGVSPRQPQAAAKGARRNTRQPVVRVDQVIRQALARDEALDVVSEGADLTQEPVLVEGWIPGRQVDHPAQGSQLLHGGAARVHPGCEHVGGDAPAAELVADLANIDAESAVRVAAESSRRGGVQRDHGHALYAALTNSCPRASLSHGRTVSHRATVASRRSSSTRRPPLWNTYPQRSKRGGRPSYSAARHPPLAIFTPH